MKPQTAIHTSGLLGRQRNAEQALELLSNVSRALDEPLEPERLLAKVAEIVVSALADWCLIDVLEGRELRPAAEQHRDKAKLSWVEQLHRSAHVDLESYKPQARAFSSREPVLVREVTPDFSRAAFTHAEQLRLFETLEPRSLMLLPVVSRGSSIGLLTLVRCDANRRYGRAELSLAKEVAARLGLALDNVRLGRDLAMAMQPKSEADRYLQTIFRRVPGAIWATDRALRIIYVGGNVPRASGLDAKTLVTSTVYDVVGSREPTKPGIAHHLAALSGEPQAFHCQYNGRWYELLIEPLRDSDQRIVGAVGAVFDVTERRATEERLARNEARLAEAQRVAHVGSFEWEIQSNVVSWTEELHRIYGIEPGQFDGTFEAFLKRVHPADLDKTRKVLFKALRERTAFVYDHRVLRPDGSVRVLHTRGLVITDSQGKAIRMVGTCWDVTELCAATEAREHTLSLLQAAVEATDDGILVVDRAGKITLANQPLRALWNLPARSDLPADEETILALMLGQVADPDGFRAGVLELQDRPEMESADVVRLKDGRVFERSSRPQRIGKATVGRVWTYRDISERERLLQQAVFLVNATRLLASLDVGRALDGLAHLVVPDFGDACAVEIFGDDEARQLYAVSRDPRKPISIEPHPAVRAGRGLVYRVSSTSCLGVPFVSKSGIVGAMTLVAAPGREYTDSDLELAEELGRRAALALDNARLYQGAQEALRSRDEFLSIASHEIRGPITSLHLAVQMLRRGQIPQHLQPRAFDIIEREDRRLTTLVDELLDLSRIRAGTLHFDFEQLDLGEIVQSCASRLAPELARAGSRLSIAIDGAIRGEWDRIRLDQIITNLLTNAIKFGLGKPIEVEVSARDEIATLVVRDHGMGIASELQSRIFERFERGVSARHYGGLGLGLYIVKTIVEGLDGRVRVQSTPGEGSTFTVELPRWRRC